MEQYFSLAPQMGFLAPLYTLLAMPGNHLPLGIRSEPGSFWSKCLMLQSQHLLIPLTFACPVRMSQIALLNSTFCVLMQGLLTAPTVLEGCL